MHRGRPHPLPLAPRNADILFNLSFSFFVEVSMLSLPIAMSNIPNIIKRMLNMIKNRGRGKCQQKRMGNVKAQYVIKSSYVPVD